MAATRVVLVEYNVADAALIKHHLSRPGVDQFEVDCVGCLALLEEAGPHDAVLLDLGLPDSQGAETITRARAMTRAPIVVLTGTQDDALEHDVLALGATDFLSKSEIEGLRYRRLHRTLAFAVFRAREERLARLEATYARQIEHNERLVTLGRLASGIAHEINNPLTYLRGNVELLRDMFSEIGAGTLDDDAIRKTCTDARGMLDDCEHGLDRITKTARMYRDFAALETADLKPRTLDAIARDAARLVRPQLSEGIELRLELEGTPVSEVSVERLTNVVVHLLLNAIQALEGAGAGHIRLTTRAVGSLAQLTVEDDGPGVSKEERQRIFEPFFTTKRLTGGTGLGLYVSAETARLHGGHLALDEAAEEGARFVLSLPVRRKARAPQPLPRSVKPRARVLLVDDEPAILRAYTRLMATSYEVVTAAGGQQAIELLAEDDGFDVVVCDIMMPGQDAVDVVEALTCSHEHLLDRLLFVTAGAVSPRAKRIHERFGDRVLMKPVTREALEGAIYAVLSRCG